MNLLVENRTIVVAGIIAGFISLGAWGELESTNRSQSSGIVTNDVSFEKPMGSLDPDFPSENENPYAFECLQKAEAGDRSAQYELGLLYYAGGGFHQNYAEAAKWLRMSASQGSDIFAAPILADIYDRGLGVAGNKAEAAKWYRKAAEKGLSSAQFRLGVMYWNGDGVDENKAEAISLLHKAVERGEEAADTYLKAIVEEDANAQFRLGTMYENGDGVGESMGETVNWFRKAAANGHTEAQYKLGCMYDNGEGVAEDNTEAGKWYLDAAVQGHVPAQFNLGLLYALGEGVTENKTEAAKWWSMAAESGYAPAQFNLGCLFDEGLGVALNMAEATRWYRKAAEQGNAKAQNNFGSMYANGEGVLQDDIEAMKWFLLASAKGYGDSTSIQNFRRSMALTDYAEAQRRAKEWTKQHDEAGSQEAEYIGGDNLTGVSGTAFCISANGYFLTCAHVVANAIRIVLDAGGKTYRAEVVMQDRVNDIAILKVDGNKVSPIPLVNDEPALGDKVFTLGYPNPELQGLAPKYTDGAISALSGIQDDPRAYQITVPVQSGNSGGPLVDQRGNCVGIVVAKLNAVAVLEYTGDIPQNVNFAVKTAYAWPLVNSVPGLKAQLPAAQTASPAVIADVEKAVGLVRVTVE